VKKQGKRGDERGVLKCSLEEVLGKAGVGKVGMDKVVVGK
jgi:hypothetical protein